MKWSLETVLMTRLGVDVGSVRDQELRDTYEVPLTNQKERCGAIEVAEVHIGSC